MLAPAGARVRCQQPFAAGAAAPLSAAGRRVRCSSSSSSSSQRASSSTVAADAPARQTATTTSLHSPVRQQQQQQPLALAPLPPPHTAAAAAAGSTQQWLAGATAAAGVAVAAGALLAAAGPAHAEVAQLSQAMGALKIPGIIGDSQFTEGFVSGLLLIFFSEIGDKTFFIALLLALREDRTAVFAGTFGALAVMTVISVALGQVFHQLDELLPVKSSLPLDDLLAVALLLYFGITTLKGAADADAKAAEEKEEADEVVSGLSGGGSGDAATATAGLVATTFGLVFAAEWGDKSFLATIALAAASDPAGVVVGAITGHGLATGIAVAGGSLLSKYISERTAQYIGGGLFLVFAAATVFDLATGAHGGG